ncbi:hypothetical protein AOA80_06885 [Methanomassiliicoccales archaeon RumEn M1]|nr:hypothetical protein AOA80_06885 [Methanomassiliicoccales archaeon RumEn M1]
MVSRSTNTSTSSHLMALRTSGVDVARFPMSTRSLSKRDTASLTGWGVMRDSPEYMAEDALESMGNSIIVTSAAPMTEA